MRHESRVAALQLLYQLDLSGRFGDWEAALPLYFMHLAPEVKGDVRSFAEQLCRGAVERLEEIDDLLEAAASNWRLERMSGVDRNILRLATGELLGDDRPPLQVVINEAIELAKAFGTTESAGFVNGVLNRVARELEDEG